MGIHELQQTEINIIEVMLKRQLKKNVYILTNFEYELDIQNHLGILKEL